MKNLLIMICIIIATSLSTQLYAQSSTIVGLRGGTSFSTLNENPTKGYGNELDKKMMLGIDAAVFAKLSLSDVFSVQPEVQFIQKGVKYTMENADAGDVKLVERYNYLEVPVLARFDFGVGSFVGDSPSGVGFNLFIGPSVGYALNGKIKAENIQIGSESQLMTGDFEEDVEWDDEFGTDGIKDNRWDVNGVIGFGVEFNCGEVILLFDGRYSMDFTDQISYENEPNPEPDKFYDRTIAATVGIAVPLGK